MSYELIIFTDPLNANAFLIHDGGLNIVGHSTIHPTGRPGIGFTIPDNTQQGWGARIRVELSGKVSINQKGILWLRTPDMENKFPWTHDQTAAFNADDFILQNEKVCPEPTQPTPVPIEKPKDIINRIYSTGNFNLATKEGCGKFTEACTTELHNKHSLMWGHIRKFPPQNMYNGHAVDAIMILAVHPDGTQAGIYDIIHDSESPSATPQFIFKGPPDSNLWYYPAENLMLMEN